MFKISLKNVGENRVTKDAMTNLNYLMGAEEFAKILCRRILGYDDFLIMPRGNGEYDVRRGMVLVGSFTITRLH